MKAPNPRHAVMALLVLSLALYLTLLGAPPLNWDDDTNIFANPFFRAGVWSEFWRNSYFGLYVPLTSTLWEALYVLGHGAAWPFRAANAVLHAVNVLLVYRVIAARRPGWPAVFGAALFALHPLQTAAVAWISGGRDLLAATFALLSLRAIERRRPAGALAAFAAAVLAKPSVVTWPLIWPLVARAGDRRRLAPWIAAGLALSALATWRTLGAQDGHLPAIDWWLRPWLIGDTYWFYLTRLTGFAPLAANYARTPDVVLGTAATLATALIPYALAAYAGWRRPVWASYAAAAALTLLPVSGLVSFGYQETSGVADHYAYLPLALVALLVADQVARAPGRRWTAVAMLILVAAFGVRSAARLDVWRSNEAFFADMARVAPTAYATALGSSNVACGERRDFDAGLRWTAVALAARPRDARALANRAYCLLHAGRAREVAAMDDELESMDLDRLERTEPTGYSSLLASIGTALIEIGENEVGYQYLCEAARILPGESTHQHNLVAGAALLRQRGVVPSCDDEDDE